MAGINYLFGFELNSKNIIIVIITITLIALFSVLRGLNAGIKRLSEINIFWQYVFVYLYFYLALFWK